MLHVKFTQLAKMDMLHVKFTQIAKMEQIILQTLDFRLVAPTTYDFLLRYLKAASLEQRQQASPSSNQSTDWSSQVVDSLSKVGVHEEILVVILVAHTFILH